MAGRAEHTGPARAAATCLPTVARAAPSHQTSVARASGAPPPPPPSLCRLAALRPLPAPVRLTCCRPLRSEAGAEGAGRPSPRGRPVVWVPQSCWGPASAGRVQAVSGRRTRGGGADHPRGCTRLSLQVRECVRVGRSARRRVCGSEPRPTRPGAALDPTVCTWRAGGFRVRPPSRFSHQNIKLPKVKLTDKKYFN